MRCASTTRASSPPRSRMPESRPSSPDAIINEGFKSLTEILGGRPVNFVVLRPPVALLRQRGIDRLPEEAAYLAHRYGNSDHPESRLSPAGFKPQPKAGRSTSLRRSSSAASIACRTLDFGLIPAASIRRAWWIFC
jgi:hypothetical protein